MTRFDFYPPEKRGALERYAAEYSFTQDEPTAWTPLRRDLRDCRAVVITTAGLRLKTQHEFRADRVKGTAEFREISSYARRQDLAFDFVNYDPREAERDLNVIVPVDRVKEQVEKGVLGGMNETFFSFYGLCEDLAALKASAREAAARAAADIAFVVPANHVCNQTAGLLSREFERAGTSTVTLITIREVAVQVKVPRPLFVNFPFGRTMGRTAAQQRTILGDMIHALKHHDRPGRITDLPYKWEGSVE